MRKKIFSIVFVAAIAIAAAWNFTQSSKAEVELSDIALANVEALASGEGGLGGKQAYMKGAGWCCGSGQGICSKYISC
jgi:hypothetical protein